MGKAKERNDVEKAIKIYIPSIAPSSLMQYSGSAFPEWQGDLFSGALAQQHINQIKLDSNNNVIEEKRLLENNHGRIRSLVEDKQGWIYFGNDNGTIYRIKPN